MFTYDEEVRLNLFIGDEDRYGLNSEMYLNIDFPQGLIELRAKDEEYRGSILQALPTSPHGNVSEEELILVKNVLILAWKL